MMPAEFFGRKDYLELLSKRIVALKDGYRQNLAIIGDETVGKSSLVFKFLNNFWDNRIIMLYLEARPEDAGSFARRFSAALLYNFLANSGLRLQEDLDFLIAKAQRYAPKTAEKIKSILNSATKRKTTILFGELLSLCEIIREETGKSCAVIFDEFQHLEGLGFKNFYREWSKALIQQKNTLYIIISSQKFKTRAVLAKNLSLLFGNFEVVEVEPFNIKTTHLYLENRIGNLIKPGIKDFLVHFTGGMPLYLEIISEAILKAGPDKTSEALEELFFLPSGILNQRFSNYIKRFADSNFFNDYISVLYLVASGRNKVKDIAQILHKPRKDLDKRLERLLELDTLCRSADFLKISDRVFGFWLRFVYQEKLRSLTFDAKNQKEKFRDNIEAMLGGFLRNAQKSLPQRMSEALGLFADDTAQIERRRVRLSHFREIKPVEFAGRSLKDGLVGRSTESLWIMGFKQGGLSEEDISEFIRECKKFRHKQQKKIIVTLGEIDANTRLKALEEKIWAWDIDNLNQVFDLFSLDRVVA
jgi:hypothetical protein